MFRGRFVPLRHVRRAEDAELMVLRGTASRIVYTLRIPFLHDIPKQLVHLYIGTRSCPSHKFGTFSIDV